MSSCDLTGQALVGLLETADFEKHQSLDGLFRVLWRDVAVGAPRRIVLPGCSREVLDVTRPRG